MTEHAMHAFTPAARRILVGTVARQKEASARVRVAMDAHDTEGLADAQRDSMRALEETAVVISAERARVGGPEGFIQIDDKAWTFRVVDMPGLELRPALVPT